VLVHRMKKHERGIYAVAISPNGRYVATGSSDKLGNLWDLDGREPKLMGILEGHEDAVEALAFSPDNKRLFSGSHDGKIRIWLVDGSEFKAGPILPDAAQPD